MPGAARRLHKPRFELTTRVHTRDARLSRRKIPIIPREFLSVYTPSLNAIFCFEILRFFSGERHFDRVPGRGKIKYRLRRRVVSAAARVCGELTRFFL